MKLKAEIVFFSCFVLFVIGIKDISAQLRFVDMLIKTETVFNHQTEDEIRNKRITLHQTEQPLAYIFERLSYFYDVKIGFEKSMNDDDHDDYMFEIYRMTFTWNPRKSEERCCGYVKYSSGQHPITVNVENARLEDVMNDIVGQMKNYNWEINEGIINIYPKKGRNPVYENLLKLKIKDFKFESGRKIVLIWDDIEKLPEIQEYLAENGLKLSKGGVVSNSHAKTLDKEISFSDLSLKELLNKLAQINGCGWILQKEKKYKSKEKTHVRLDI
jgi:hypothetical protein